MIINYACPECGSRLDNTSSRFGSHCISQYYACPKCPYFVTLSNGHWSTISDNIPIIISGSDQIKVKSSNPEEKPSIYPKIYSTIGKINCVKPIDGITPMPMLKFKDWQGQWIQNMVSRICKQHGHTQVKITLEVIDDDHEY